MKNYARKILAVAFCALFVVAVCSSAATPAPAGSRQSSPSQSGPDRPVQFTFNGYECFVGSNNQWGICLKD